MICSLRIKKFAPNLALKEVDHLQRVDNNYRLFFTSVCTTRQVYNRLLSFQNHKTKYKETAAIHRIVILYNARVAGRRVP